jgi:succinoglycan biosynthesis protein ExoM
VQVDTISTSIVICTVARRDLANACIASVLAQREVDLRQLEVVIVDNSESGYFQDGATAWADRAPCPVVYLREPVPNIARARNAGCWAARGAFIVFIDDDERADPLWLARLMRAAEEWQADAVYGPVLPDFECGEPPAWDPTGSCFRQFLDLQPGAWLEIAYTHNLLVRRSTCIVRPEPFDTRYGRTGSEDTAFTYGLTRRGRKIVWCPDAVVHEFVPRKRMDPAFHLYRVFVQTQNFFRIQVAHEPFPRAVVRGVKIAAYGLRKVLHSLPLVAMTLFSPPERAFPPRRLLCHGLGALTWPLRFRRY